MAETSKLVLEFPDIPQETLINALAKAYGYAPMVRKPVEGGGQAFVPNTDSKEAFVTNAIANNVLRFYKKGYIEAKADEARVKAQEELKAIVD
jgi:hypothetical protein